MYTFIGEYCQMSAYPIKNKILLIASLLFIIFSSCKEEKPQPGKNIEISEKDSLIQMNNDSFINGSDSCIKVSRSLENDQYFNNLLATYICTSLKGEKSLLSATEIRQLANRPSFLKTILFFYKKENSNSLAIEDDVLYDFRRELLYGIKDCCIETLYMIADTLLTDDNFDGVEVLWGKTNLDKLPSMPKYLQRVDTGNFFVYADLAAIFHNSAYYKKQDIYMSKASKCKNFADQFNTLKSLMDNNKKFDIITYKELVYGGL